MDELLVGVHERLASRRRWCSVILSSRIQPPFTVIEQQDRIALTLPMLEKPAVDLYLEQIGMLDPALRQYVYDLTYGHALCVSIVGLLWQEQGDHPFTGADLPKLQAQFNERALLELIRERLDTRLKTPYRELTRYGVLLRSFNLPLLQAIFPELLPDTEALDRFHHLLRYPYIESLGNQHYAFHDLLRELQATEVRDQQPDKWREYHKRALDYLTQTAPFSPDWYYHAIAYNEEQGISDWWKAVQEPRNYGMAYLDSLFQAAYDVALKLTPVQAAHRTFRLGRFYYSGYGGMQLGAAQECYQEAFSLYRQVGDRLGEANCYLAQGRVALQEEDYPKGLALHTQAYQLYRQIQDGYSQARLLYYRSLVYEAMGELRLAIEDVKEALAIAQALNLPFLDLFQERLDDLQSP